MLQRLHLGPLNLLATASAFGDTSYCTEHRLQYISRLS
jgi:hypothetical protein